MGLVDWTRVTKPQLYEAEAEALELELEENFAVGYEVLLEDVLEEEQTLYGG